MGQYALLCNLSKRQYIRPDAFHDGAKFLEFGHGPTMQALLGLLVTGNGMAGTAEFVRPLSKFSRKAQLLARRTHTALPQTPSPLYDPIGSWAGDRIVVAGDYAHDGHLLTTQQRKALTAAQRMEWRRREQSRKRRVQTIPARAWNDAVIAAMTQPEKFEPVLRVYRHVTNFPQEWTDVSDKIRAVLTDMGLVGLTPEKCQDACDRQLHNQLLRQATTAHALFDGRTADLTWLTAHDLEQLCHYAENAKDLRTLKTWCGRKRLLIWQQEILDSHTFYRGERATDYARIKQATDASREMPGTRLLPSPAYLLAALHAEAMGDTTFLHRTAIQTATSAKTSKARRSVRSAVTPQAKGTGSI